MRVEIGLAGDKQVSRELLRFGERALAARPAFEAIGELLIGLEREQFATEGQSESGGWAPLADSTLRYKTGPSILDETGELRASLTERGDPHQIFETGDYIAGLRTLADLLEQHDELPLPYHGRGPSALLWIEAGRSDEQQRDDAQVFARLVPGAIRKNVRGVDFDLIGAVEGLHVQMILRRDAVCTRVVTGTREVTREVPDPGALASVPKVTVTETVEDVEWDCGPILTRRTREQEMQDAANDGYIDNYDPDIDAAGADDYLSDVTA